jgi:hypothetical protein
VLPLNSWTSGTHINAIPGALMSALLLLVILGGALFVTWYSIRKAGALPHPETEMGVRRRTLEASG